MDMTNTLISKVLILDDATPHLERLKSFYADCGLLGIRPQRNDDDSVVALLRSNVDLGGIMLYEHFGGTPGRGVALAREIHAARPELPLFLRRDTHASVAGLAGSDAAMFRCAYTLDDLQQLRAPLEASIFSRFYPTDLVRGIGELTRASLESLFDGCEIDLETPYLVKDRIIYGEVFTMIAIESHWCRGTMMLQAAESAMLDLIGRSRPQAAAEAGSTPGSAADFRELNALLGEATNLIWGSFRNRYVGHADGQAGIAQTQVPVVINHHRNYISFGADDPQLCFRYTLRDPARPSAPPVPLFQRFVFNLCWSPDEFRENPTVESLVSSGELELF